jgi:glyoxylase-like metal-dependent hydrolase (beta-lactamase superfamily II)
MLEPVPGVRKATFALPLGIDHVHCYFLRSGDGSWTLVDAGLGVADAEAVWSPLLRRLDGPVQRIVVTHLHPDHLGGSADVAELTGAVVLQGRRDYEQALGAWGEEAPALGAAHMRRHGMPAGEAAALERESRALRQRVRFVRGPELLDEDDRVDGWRVLELPGHADGHITLFRDGVLIAGDTVLGRITPTVGLYPLSRPDPLRDYLASLARIAGLGARVALAGHEQEICDVPGRVAQLAEHHRKRLDACLGVLGDGPRTAHAVSLELFPGHLPVAQRRFALAETLAHLERLGAEGRVARLEGGGTVEYAAAGASG